MAARIGLAAALLLLAACAAGPPPPEAQWTRRDASPEDIKRDLYWCTRTVLGKREFNAGGNTPRESTQVVNDECMQQRGYTKRAAAR